jgi:hypothetical protein
MKSLPPRTNIDFDGSLACGISSYQSELADQSKCRWRKFATPISEETKQCISSWRAWNDTVSRGR